MKSLVILVASMSSVGHVNSCAGATRPLLARGHRVIFLLEEAFRGKVALFGFEERIYQKRSSKNVDNTGSGSGNAGESLAKHLKEKGIIGPGTPEQKMLSLSKLSASLAEEFIGSFNEAVKKAIEELSPDLIWFDGGTLLPAIHYSGFPWIMNLSMTPIFYEFDDDLPPGGSGLPYSDRSAWSAFNAIRKEWRYSKTINDYFEQELGYPRYPGNIRFPSDNRLLTVYATPEELNYPAIRAKADWFNLEVFQKPIKQNVPLEKLLPVSFLNDNLGGQYSGKLIYLSMGSMGSVDLNLMRRLVEVLGKTNHKYIVSKGHLHDQYKLASNMYGERYLPQTKILPHVHLVITHGGNNTVTETFAEGKRMVILPLFADQFDNAQRLHELGFGARVDTYGFTDEQLIGAIDRMLADTEVEERLSQAAARISTGDQHEKLAMKVEAFFK